MNAPWNDSNNLRFKKTTILIFLFLTLTLMFIFFILSLTCFSDNCHSHDYNKEESKTALYGTKITLPECTVCPAANHANTVTPHSLASHAYLQHPKHTHTHFHKNTYTQNLITDIHTEVTATTVYTVLRQQPKSTKCLRYK